MAVFICECCGATLKKQQIDKHCETRCKSAWAFTCVECTKTFEGYDYKNHNECMTEVQKYQGKFIERQRQEKERDKKDQAEKKMIKKTEKKEDEGSDKQKPETTVEDEISPTEATRLRKFLKKETEFYGYDKTAVMMLKEHKDGMKAKHLAKHLRNCFRLSEDFDSDSDCSDEDNKLYRKGLKSIQKVLAKSDKLVIDNDIAKLA